MLTVYFVRHGETDWNAEGRLQGLTDTPLNEKGLEQARRLAARLAVERDLAALYSSPLQRARITGELIGKPHSLRPILDSRLVERQLGRLEGMTWEQIRDCYPEVIRAWEMGLPRPSFSDEETREQFLDRTKTFLADLSSRHDSQKVAVVAHGGTMSMLLAVLLHLDLDRRLPFAFDNASLTVAELNGPAARLRLMNDTCHLRDQRSPFGEKEEFIQDEKMAGDQIPAEMI